MKKSIIWFCFSMMRGKFCHSCFEITARTVLALFGHITLKTKVRFQKEGGGVRLPDLPLWQGCKLELARTRSFLPNSNLKIKIS